VLRRDQVTFLRAFIGLGVAVASPAAWQED
jgi:hypothetical protein